MKLILKWARARAVVSNRLINVYNPDSWSLRFLYRFYEFNYSVAGLFPVN
jgi:hypothetical protein